LYFLSLLFVFVVYFVYDLNNKLLSKSYINNIRRRQDLVQGAQKWLNYKTK